LKLYFADFDFDLEQLELRRAGQHIKAEPVVLRLLAVLLRNAGRLVSKQELIAQVWDGRAVAENVITVAMVRLRKTLGHKSGELEFIENVQRRGYRFVVPVALQQAQRPRAAEDAPIAPFVGRERLLRALRDALAEATRGQGNACVLFGEPGIGKTRAIEVLSHELVASGECIAWGHCRESGDTPPLWPFAQIMRQLLAALGEQPGAELRAWTLRTPELLSLLPELVNSDAGGARPAAASGELTRGSELVRHSVFDAVMQFFSRAATVRPCVVVLDDLQRADAASLELLQFWIDQLPHMRILLLGTLNRLDLEHEAQRVQLAYVHGHRNTRRLELERLTEADVARYVSALIDDPDGTLAHAVFRKSEGNPFFMSELARQLSDREHGTPSELSLPACALDLIRGRLVLLDDEARGALSSAAVIGRRFELPVLQALLNDQAQHADAGALMTTLDRALAHKVILDTPDSRTTFRFGHELQRVALYDSLPPARRRQLHGRLAGVLEERRDGGAAVAFADLAFHFHAALPDCDLSKAVHYCARAAIESSKLFAYADSMRYLRNARQALELQDNPNPDRRLTLLMRQALCARACGDPDFEPLTRELIRLATQRRAGAHLAWGAFLLDLNPGFPPLGGAREAAEAALALAPADDHATRAALLARLAASAPLAYDARASLEQVTRAVELAKSAGVPVALLAARSWQLYLCGGERDQTMANQALAALEHVCAQHPLRLTVPPVLIELHRAIRALQAGELASLDASLERCAALCHKLGHRELLWHIARSQAVQRVNIGDETGGIRALQALHARALRDAVPGTLLFRAYDQCLISPAVANLSTSELRSALAPDPGDGPNIWSMKLRTLAQAGLHDEARSRLRQVAPEQLRLLPRDRDYLGTLGSLVHAVIELAELAYLAPLHALLGEYPGAFCAHFSFLCEGSVVQLQGVLARSLGRHADATRQLAQGAALAERSGLVRGTRAGHALPARR
jgi:eukaryotic-like serine/threonine-protein kinase